MSEVENVKIGVCFIFNHPFPKQIPVIRDLYKSRFSKMLFLIPFDREHAQEPDVHTVYRTAFSFDGMIVEARRRIKEQFADCSHVMFVHNDLLLSGDYDEKTSYKKLQLDRNAAFIAELGKIEGGIFGWLWLARFAYRWKFPMDFLLGSGAEKAKQYLPSLEQIESNSKKAGFNPSQSFLIRDEERKGNAYFFNYIDQQLFENRHHLDENGRLNLGYPIFNGYSDLFAVPMDGIDEWLHLLGLLCAMDLFPEISIPTSLVWHYGDITTSQWCHLKNSTLWNNRHLADDINWVIGQYEAGDNYIHPVKYEKYSQEDYSRLTRCLMKN